MEEIKKLIQRIYRFSISESSLDDIRELNNIQSKIRYALKSEQIEIKNQSTEYELLIGLYYDLENWQDFGDNTLADISKFKEYLRTNELLPKAP